MMIENETISDQSGAVVAVLSEALVSAELVPVMCGVPRREDETANVGDVSLVVAVSGMEEHEILDGVWDVTGVVRLYVREAKRVSDTDRREWLGAIERWLRAPDVLTAVNSVQLAGASAKFFLLEVAGPVTWDDDDRALWGEVSWRGKVDVN